jgi:superfamily II DNA or RNA helicase
MPIRSPEELSNLCGRVTLFFKEYRPEVPAIVFVRLKKDCTELAAHLEAVLGFEVEWVTGDRKRKDRAAIAERMRTGALKVAVATEAWSTGIDIPGLKSVVMACGGSAPIGLKQRAGRGTRLAKGKYGFIIYDLNLGADNGSQAKRQERYVEGGYEVEGANVGGAAGYVAPEEDGDLAELLSGGGKRPRAQQRREKAGRRRKRKAEAEQQQQEFEQQMAGEDPSSVLQQARYAWEVIATSPLPKFVDECRWLQRICAVIVLLYIGYLLCQ